MLLYTSLKASHDFCFISCTLPAEKRRTSENARQRRKADVVVQVALLAENERLQTILGTYGIATQTQQQIEPINICPPSTLIQLYSQYVWPVEPCLCAFCVVVTCFFSSSVAVGRGKGVLLPPGYILPMCVHPQLTHPRLFAVQAGGKPEVSNYGPAKPPMWLAHDEQSIHDSRADVRVLPHRPGPHRLLHVTRSAIAH